MRALASLGVLAFLMAPCCSLIFARNLTAASYWVFAAATSSLDNVVSCAALSRQLISSPNMLSCMDSLLTAAFWWFKDSNFGRLSPFTSAVNPAKSCLDPSTMETSSLQACANTQCGTKTHTLVHSKIIIPHLLLMVGSPNFCCDMCG